jgi:hypothetical protein
MHGTDEHCGFARTRAWAARDNLSANSELWRRSDTA